MKLHEYQSKNLFRESGITIPDGSVVSSVKSAEKSGKPPQTWLGSGLAQLTPNSDNAWVRSCWYGSPPSCACVSEGCGATATNTKMMIRIRYLRRIDNSLGNPHFSLGWVTCLIKPISVTSYAQRSGWWHSMHFHDTRNGGALQRTWQCVIGRI